MTRTDLPCAAPLDTLLRGPSVFASAEFPEAFFTNPLFRHEVCGGDFEGELVRSTVDITRSLPFAADKVRLLVQAEGIRQ